MNEAAFVQIRSGFNAGTQNRRHSGMADNDQRIRPSWSGSRKLLDTQSKPVNEVEFIGRPKAGEMPRFGVDQNETTAHKQAQRHDDPTQSSRRSRDGKQ